MISLFAVRVGRHGYYLETAPAGRRPGTALVEPDGTWVGSAAAGLGLAASVVVRDALGAVLAGIDPLSGEVLDRRHGAVRVAAFDCTFTPPKSVSILHALASDTVSTAVRDAHVASVHATLGYLERHAAAVRRSHAGKQFVVPAASGLCAADFVHRSSRAGDPHLHSHVVVANLAADGDGGWSALDARGLFLHAGAASALYSAQLRAELARRLGLAFDPSSRHYDVAGIERRVIVAFSRRSQAIAAALADADGPVSPRVSRRAHPPSEGSLDELRRAARRVARARPLARPGHRPVGRARRRTVRRARRATSSPTPLRRRSGCSAGGTRSSGTAGRSGTA